jgi:hypothetical protein
MHAYNIKEPVMMETDHSKGSGNAAQIRPGSRLREIDGIVSEWHWTDLLRLMHCIHEEMANRLLISSPRNLGDSIRWLASLTEGQRKSLQPDGLCYLIFDPDADSARTMLNKAAAATGKYRGGAPSARMAGR